MEIVRLKVSELTPYKNNAKIHTPEQIEQIKASIEEFGMCDPIGIWGGNNIVVEGHGRLLALKQMGVNEVDCIRLDHLNEEQRKAYTLVHNKLTIDTGFDFEILEDELASMEINMQDFGFEFDDGIELEEEKETIDDNFEVNLPSEPMTMSGQVWQLGSHRLMVGDSTKKEDVEKLMNGNVADLVVTDPPYNVSVSNSKGMTIANDNMKKQEFLDFLTKCFENIYSSLKDGGAFYIWYASCEHINFETALNNARLSVREQIIWNKNMFVLGRQDYHWKHEVCLYGWKDGCGHYFAKDRTQSTVFEDEDFDFENLDKEELVELVKDIYKNANTTIMDEKKPLKNDLHPTMKPIPLIGRQVRNSSQKNENVLDLFGGSGTTILACEQLDRRCFTMEYDPKYADVIIQRWESFTGEKAVLLDE